MMSEWNEYKIDTPTFHITPVEKPDMSPFLIHMTGKNEIINILKGKDKGYGCLQANVPEYNQNGSFDARVVCFSESPIFALEFFCRRKYARWKDNQRFGIGFDKHAMVTKGARPVIYVQDNVIEDIISLFHKIKEKESESESFKKLKDVLSHIYPLLFPLGENFPLQGFMWEREWRYTEPNGLIFSHKDIKIICCPVDEESEIQEILSDEAENIIFVHTWQEYDDVTNYLKQQESKWQVSREQYESSDDKKQSLQNLIQQYKLTYQSLDSYERHIRTISQNIEQIPKRKELLEKEIQEFEQELEKMETKN